MERHFNREILALGRNLNKIADQLAEASFRQKLVETPSLQEGLEMAISFNATCTGSFPSVHRTRS